MITRTSLRVAYVLVLLMSLPFVDSSLASPPDAVVASSKGPMDTRELEAFMDGAVSAQMRAHHIPGATVAVVKDDRIILAKGYGYADIDKRKAVVANQTLFRIGSVSKLFIWTAVMQLAEQGKLDLDADINIYLQDFQTPATYPQPITLKNLMTHTPGFEDLATGGRLFVRNETDIISLGAYLSERMPARVRPPGEVTAYSNYGSVLAAYIVEQVSGMPFDRYVEERILYPLGMNNTTFAQPLTPGLARNMSSGHIYSNNAYTAEPFEYLQAWPAGSMSSTSEDMAKFMIAHLQNGRYGNISILREDTATRLHSQLFSNDPRVSGWTYGFWEMRLNNQSIIGHGGDTILFHTLMELIPEDNLGIFLSLNEQASEPAGVELLQAFMDRYYPVPPPPVPDAITGFEQNASRFTGSYRPARSAFSNFEKVSSISGQVQVYPGPNGTLITAQPGFGQQQWVQVEPLSFRPAQGVPTPFLLFDGLVFGEDGQGRISHLFYANNPTTAYEKVNWHDEASFNYLLLGACILLFLSTLLWPLGRLCNRCPALTEKPARAARTLAGGAGILNLLFLTGLVAISAIDAMSLIYGTPAYLTALAMVAIIAAIMAIVSAAFVVLAWKRGYWSMAGRLHYTLVAAAGLAFIWWLNNWNLLGFKF